MIREINISDAKEIQKICKTALGYDVDIDSKKIVKSKKEIVMR